MIPIIDFYSTHTVDLDFDEIFYKQEYPETTGFYQPYCTENNISEKQRLFYHWYYYGKSAFYKTLNDKIKDQFDSKISYRTLDKPNKLAILTCIFNPCNYQNIVNNYQIFANQITDYADLYTIELSFYDHFISVNNSIHIEGKCNNIVWQKERLLNIQLTTLPDEYTDIAWIDADVLFENSTWITEAEKLLDKYKIVQLFETVHLLNKNNEIIQSKESIVKNHSIGESGYGWIARREILDQIGLLDNQILGGADLVMASAFMNRLDILTSRNLKFFNDLKTYEWINLAIDIVGMSVGFIDQQIKHLYHGDKQNRQYEKRQNIVKQIDPELLKTNFDGIWELKQPSVNGAIMNYFSSRNEDDLIV